MASPRLALVTMMARRLALRPDRPPRSVLRWLWGSLAVTAAGASAVFLGSTHFAWVGLVAVGSMAALVGAALRFFPTAMAVSVVGIALSCASLMTVLGVTSGFEAEVVRSVAKFNGHVLLTEYGLDFDEYDEVSTRLLKDPRIIAASPFAYSMIAVVRVTEPHEDNDGPLVVIGKGVDPKRAANLEGFAESFQGGSLDALRPGGTLVTPGLVLGDALARELGVSVGDKVRVVVPAEITGAAGELTNEPRHAEFELTDLIHTGVSELDRNLAMMHLTAGQALFFGEGRVTGIELQLTDPRDAKPVAKDIEAILNGPSVPRFRTSTWEETNASLLIALRQVRIAVVIILGLMSVVASSSLVASLLLIVRRKRHDIGVMMAVGSSRALVFWVFESIGLVAGLAGAVLGLMLGGLYCLVIQAYQYPLVGDVYPVDHMPVELGVLDALVPAIVAVGLCGLASGPVAVRASKVRLLSALGR